jgi:hypothetical protein
MPTPLIFVGKPLAFLKSIYPHYRLAAEDHAGKEAALNIVRRFNKRFSLLKDLSDEPTDEFLKKVNDDDPDEQYEKPDPKNKSDEEYKKLLETWETTMRVAQTRKEVGLCDSFELLLLIVATANHAVAEEGI